VVGRLAPHMPLRNQIEQSAETALQWRLAGGQVGAGVTNAEEQVWRVESAECRVQSVSSSERVSVGVSA